MTFYRKALRAAFLAILLCASIPAFALNLISPTDQQVVRENVRIVIPADVLPEGGFISLFISSTDQIKSENFSVALNPDRAIRKAGKVIFLWDSKVPLANLNDPKSEIQLKDGPYTIKVNVHGLEAKLVDSATIRIVLRNKIARSNPAPAILLKNKLGLAQTDKYYVAANAQVYNEQSLPILGNLGLAAAFSLYQSVEDVWPDGTRLIRYKMDSDAYVSTFGALRYLYPSATSRPMLYKRIDAKGNVVSSNVFSRQKMYSILDVLPVLPKKKVKEGDSWNDKLSFKVDGITDMVRLTGTAVLDSFEWEQGKQCAKIISNLSTSSRVSLLDGRLTNDVGKMTARVVTFFDYKNGRSIRREIEIQFPALIQQGLDTSTGGAGRMMGMMGTGKETFGGPGGTIPTGGAMGPGMGMGMPGAGMGPGMGMGMPGAGAGGVAGMGMPGAGMGPGMRMGMPGAGAGGAAGMGMPGAGMGPGMGMGMPGAGAGGVAGMGMPGAGMGPGMGMGMPGAGAGGAAAAGEDGEAPTAGPMASPFGGAMGGMGRGTGSTLSLNNADKGSVVLNAVIQWIK